MTTHPTQTDNRQRLPAVAGTTETPFKLTFT